MPIESINIRLGKLPSRDLLSEKDIQLLKGAVLGLGEPEEGPDEEEEGSAAPDKR